MSAVPIEKYFGMLCTAASESEVIHPQILESAVIDALEYASINDFIVTGGSIAAHAVGILVAILGRSEGGKTLSSAVVNSVMVDVKNNMNFKSIRFQIKALSACVRKIKTVTVMAVSDANKMLMLQSEGAIETLLHGLLLDSPRRSEDGADALQEACSALLLSLALFGPWAEALRAHPGAVRALHDLLDGDAGTEASRQSAESTLFELEGRKAKGPSSAKDGGGIGSSAKHVMISYCWEEQPVIKRVCASLVRRGYAVWIDIEQMTGSTVESMAAAVENAEVMLVGVSRQYKESTNCRLEAQYAMQREVPTVPLMLVDGYRADGWLGMLIGTRMWYSFYGPVLLEDSLFEGRMSELCRDLGDRGRSENSTSGLVTVGSSSRASASGSDEQTPQILAREHDEATFRAELHGLKVGVLRKRAMSAGISGYVVEDALDTDNPKLALMELLVQQRRESGAVANVVPALQPEERMRIEFYLHV